MSGGEGGFVRRHTDSGFTPGTGGHGEIRLGHIAEMDSALNAYIDRRGMRTPMELELRTKMREMHARRRAAK